MPFIFFLFLLPFCLGAQSPMIKTETSIVTDYESHLYWQSTIQVDTFITRYNPDGSQQSPSTYAVELGDLITRESVKTIQSSKDFLHTRAYWSDSSLVNKSTLQASTKTTSCLFTMQKKRNGLSKKVIRMPKENG